MNKRQEMFHILIANFIFTVDPFIAEQEALHDIWVWYFLFLFGIVMNK